MKRIIAILLSLLLAAQRARPLPLPVAPRENLLLLLPSPSASTPACSCLPALLATVRNRTVSRLAWRRCPRLSAAKLPMVCSVAL